MLSTLQGFVSRHRRKFIFGSVIISGGILLNKYITKIITNYQQREMNEVVERFTKLQHFESIDQLCGETAINLNENLIESVMKELNTEELVEQLKTGSGNKVAIWEELKILSFARLISFLYAGSLLMISLRLKLSLIGGYIYLNRKDANKLDIDIANKYMSLSQYFFHDGVKKLCELVKENVTSVVGGKSLKAKMTIHDIENLFWAVETSIKNDPRDPQKRLSDYMLPDMYRNEHLTTCNKTFDQMMRETLDLFECGDVQYLIGSSVHYGFNFVYLKLYDYYKMSEYASEAMTDNFVDVAKIGMPLAKIIPIINNFITPNLDNAFLSKWIQELHNKNDLKILGANVYESFSSK